jgi:phenylacetate-CoA ligase
MGKSKSNFINTFYFKSPLFIRNIFATIYGYQNGRKKFGDYFHKHFVEIKNTEYLPSSELEGIQFSRLKSFLEFVYLNSPYYKNNFQEHQFNPHTMQHPGELKKLPILGKETVRRYSREISCEKYFNNTLKIQTSGSTGKPLTIVITEDCSQQAGAYQQLLYYWNGLDKKSKMARFAGQPVAPIYQNKPPFWVTDYFNRSIYFSSYHLTEDNLRSYIDKLELFKPDILEGYPSSVYLLALANKKYNGRIYPKFIRTGSETLLDYQRQIIEDSFKCKIYNLYGSGENCVIAIECPEGKMHVQMLYGYTELIDGDGEPAKPGETARIIATGFSNKAFPLIRYDTGDLAIVSQNQICTCGRGGQLLDTVIGRIEEYILTPDGRKIGRLDHIFKGVEGVINGQIIQENIEEVIIKIAKDNTYNNSSEKRVIKNTRDRLGNEMNINIKYVNNIPKENNGKYKFIISKLSKEMIGEKLGN